MSILHDFEYYKPADVKEVFDLLDEFGKRAKILAGGTDLVVQMKENVVTPDVVIDIKAIDELYDISMEGEKLFIGACVTFTDLIESETTQQYFPLIKEMSDTVASVGIRNRATLVGNICSAVPSADSAPALLVYDAVVLVKSKSGERNIPINEWFAGPKRTVLKKSEFVAGVELQFPKKKHAGCYEKLGRYSGEDLAQAGICILVLEDYFYRVAHCAVGPIPARAKKTEEFLEGKEIIPDVLEQAKKQLLEEISPIDDIRSSKEYRIHMMGVMFERCMKNALNKLSGGIYA